MNKHRTFGNLNRWEFRRLGDVINVKEGEIAGSLLFLLYAQFVENSLNQYTLKGR